jgi:ribonuclease HI
MNQKRSNILIPSLEIYTDGSCKSLAQVRFGGWSFIALRGGEFLYRASGSEQETTNQRMELAAIRNALVFASQNRYPSEKVYIYSDSAYAINCYQKQWYDKWLQNGWVNSCGQPVANADLWQDIIPYFDNFWYYFDKVRGHADNYWNNECDRLAQTEAQTLKDNFRGLQHE